MAEKVCSRRDLEEWYSIGDVRDDNLILDEYRAAEARLAKRRASEARRR